MKTVPFLISAIVTTFVTLSPAEAAKFPRPTEDNVFTRGTTTCAFIREEWRPGMLQAGGEFVTHLRRRSILLRRAREATTELERNRFRRKARRFLRLHQEQQEVCEAGPGARCEDLPQLTLSGPLTFQLADAKGLVLLDDAAVCIGQGSVRSNLRVIENDGTLTEAVTSGVINVRSFNIEANGKVYVELDEPRNVNDVAATTQKCSLVEVDVATGVSTCVVLDENGSFLLKSGIETDSHGTVQFLYQQDVPLAVDLGRYTSGVLTTIPAGILPTSFAVHRDGRAFYTTFVSTVQGSTFVVVDSAGASTEITSAQFPNSSGNDVGTLQVLSDGNVYMSKTTNIPSSNNAIMRYLSGTDALDSQPWFDDDSFSPSNLRSAVCGAPAESTAPFCGSDGTRLREVVTANGATFALSGSTASTGSIVQILPAVEAITVPLAEIQALTSFGTALIVAGQDSSGQLAVIRYDVISKTSTLVDTLGEGLRAFNIAVTSTGTEIYLASWRESTTESFVTRLTIDGQSVTETGVGLGSAASLATF